MTSNYTQERSGRFLRFSGHPELTVQEGSHAKARSEDHTVNSHVGAAPESL